MKILLSATHLILDGRSFLQLRHNLISVPIIAKLTQHLYELSITAVHPIATTLTNMSNITVHALPVQDHVHCSQRSYIKFTHQQASQRFLSSNLFPCSSHRSTKRTCCCRRSRKRKEKAIVPHNEFGNFSLARM